MIFVSYSHNDERWRRRFEVVSKPLSRSEGIRFWSDKDVEAGEWEPQIQSAMQGAVAAVLLVSDNFLASDYIVDKELPYLFQAHREPGFMIVWAYLEPCDVNRFPQITSLQAMTAGQLEPMSKMTDWQWKETMLRGCEMIDEFLKTLERPIINPQVVGKPFPKVSDVPLLVRASRRNVEVLVYSADKKWWRQSPVKSGSTEATIHLGDDTTPKGSKYTVVALTTENPLNRQTYPNLPIN